MPDLSRRNLAGDGKHWHPVQISIDDPADGIERAGAGGSGADPELAGQPGMGAGRHGCCILVPHQHPADHILPL